MNSIISIVKGNPYDSRKGGHSYAMWTSGYDVYIKDESGNYYYQLRDYENLRVTKIDLVEIQDPTQVSWEDLPVKLRQQYFRDTHLGATEDQENLAVYGQVKGAQMNCDNAWAEAHVIHSREITLELMKKLGRWRSSQYAKTISRMVGTGYSNHIYVVTGENSQKWQVTIFANNYLGGKFYDSYKVEDFVEILAARKAFGKRAAELSKLANVPWDIAKFVVRLSDDEAITVLEMVKKSRTSDAYEVGELSCGINRRVESIKRLVKEETFNKLYCEGQEATKSLAEYLISKD